MDRLLWSLVFGLWFFVWLLILNNTRHYTYLK